MSELQFEGEELGLIDGNSFVSSGTNVFDISMMVQSKTASVTFTLPPTYPDDIPQLSAELVGVSGHQTRDFPHRTATKHGWVWDDLIFGLGKRLISFLALLQSDLREARTHHPDAVLGRSIFVVSGRIQWRTGIRTKQSGETADRATII
jgi:hypothetical protein